MGTETLTEKESIAISMIDLANAYQFQNGYDSIVLKMANKALTYFPKYIPLIMTKTNCYRTFELVEKEKINPENEVAKKYYLAYNETIKQINNLG